MIRIVLVAVCLSFSFVAFGQSQSNPFDLKYRPATAKTKSTTNPPKPSIDTVKSLPPIQKDVLVKAPKEEKKIEKDTSLDSVLKDTSSRMESNPFELEEESTPGSEEKAVQEAETSIQDPSEVTATPSLRKMPASKGIQIFFLLLSLLFLIFIVNVERSFVRDLWRVISNENYSSLHLRNQRNTMRQILLMLGYLVFVIQAGVFFFHVLAVFNYQGTLLDNIWACLALVLVVYIIRHLTIRYLRWLFNNEKEMTLYGFDISIFNIMVGLVLLPINVMLNFGPENMAKPLIIIGLIAVSLAYLMRQLRWMLTARQLIANSLILFFVYLCAVEILPLWAISKFFW